MPYSTSQYEATTRRRPGINYGNIITAEAPTARQRHFTKLGIKQQEKAIEESKRQHEERMSLESDMQFQQKKMAEQAKRTSGAQVGYSVGSAVGSAMFGGSLLGGPVGAAVGYIVSNWTHICSSIHHNIPDLIPKHEMKQMFKLRQWIMGKYPVWVKFYDESASIAIYNAYKKLGSKKFLNKLTELHKGLFTQIPVLIKMNDMQSAFEIYKDVGLKFILEFAPRFKKAADFAEKQEA